jgi:hypothetical protein
MPCHVDLRRGRTWTTSETVIQVHGVGPTGITFVTAHTGDDEAARAREQWPHQASRDYAGPTLRENLGLPYASRGDWKRGAFGGSQT